MAKIKPIEAHTHAASKETYERVYADVARFIRTKLKWRGIHTLICSQLGSALDGASVLDVGCGMGRFAFLASRRAKRVIGLDMTPQALEAASALKDALAAPNVEFILSSIEEYVPPSRPFDVVVLGGVLEHLIDPDAVMRSIGRLLRPGGRLVINCPSESNFRGDVSTTLLRLFGFPMSLCDVRIVTPAFMRQLAAQYGYELSRTVGCMYGRAWTQMGSEDLAQRVPNVLEDVAEKAQGWPADLDAFRRWVAERAEENRELLSDWERRGILKRIPSREALRYSEEVVQRRGLPPAEIREYLAPEFSSEPYYADAPPYNWMGGQAVYFLTKRRSG